MKKAFTLVELLAVIVLIGLMATIAVPVISGVIENNKKQSIVINTEKTIKAIETYKTTYELETRRELKNTSYKIENKKVIGLDLSINGTLPESGEIRINNLGDISMYVYDSGYCAVKGDLEGSVKISSITKENCNFNSNSTLASGNQVTLENGTANSIKSITIYGNSEQKTSDYKNLVDYTLAGNRVTCCTSGLTTIELIDDSTSAIGKAIKMTYNAAGTAGMYVRKLVDRLEVGKTYTWSAYVKASKNANYNIGPEQNGRKVFNVTTEYQKISNTFVADNYQYSQFTFYASQTMAIGDILYVKDIQLVEGSTLPSNYVYNTDTIPTPKYPSEINSMGSENLFDYNMMPSVNTVGGVTVSNGYDGSFKVSSVGTTATTKENSKLRYDITDLLKKYGEQTYIISSGQGLVRPYVFVDVYYNGTSHNSLLNSSNPTSNIRTITNEMLSYPDFKATIGIWFSSGDSIYNGIIYPSLKIAKVSETNYFDYTKIKAYAISGGVTLKNNNNGTFSISSISGTSTGTGGSYYTITELLKNNGEQIYTISSGADLLQPSVYVNIYYGGTWYYSWYSSTSINKQTRKLTNEILSYPDFRADIGIYWGNNISISNHTIIPKFRIVETTNAHNTSLLINGKNLLNNDYARKSLIGNGITQNGINLNYDRESGIYTLNGTSTAINNCIAIRTSGYPTYLNGTYTASVQYVSGSSSFSGIHSWQFSNYGWKNGSVAELQSNKTAVTTFSKSNVNIIYNNIRSDTGTTYNDYKFRLQLEKGVNATEYEPYKEQIINYPVTLRSLPDGTKDKIVIDNVNKRAYVERNVGYKEFDGSETFHQFEDNSEGFTRIDYGFLDSATNFSGMSTHFKQSSSDNNNAYNHFGESNSNGNVVMFIANSLLNTADITGFKSWLASEYTNGTPAAVQYKLANPVTEELEYIPIQNYDGTTNITINGTIQPSNIEVLYSEK